MPVVTLFVLPKQTRCCQFWQKPRDDLIDLSIYRSLRAPSRRRYDDGVFIVNHHVVISVLRGDLRDEEGAQNGLCTYQDPQADQDPLIVRKPSGRGRKKNRVKRLEVLFASVLVALATAGGSSKIH